MSIWFDDAGEEQMETKLRLDLSLSLNLSINDSFFMLKQITLSKTNLTIFLYFSVQSRIEDFSVGLW